MTVIDPRSIIVISSLLAVVVLIILASLRGSVPPGVRGIGAWSAAYVLIIATVVLLVLRPELPRVVGHALSNTLLVLAVLLFDMGLRRFRGADARLRPRLMAAGVVLAALTLVVTQGNDARLRLAVATSALLLAFGWTLWRHQRESQGSLAERVVLMALAVPVAGVALRLLTLDEVGRESVLFLATPVQSLYITSLGAGLLTAGVGFILMVNERTRTELETLAHSLERTTDELRQQNEIKSKFLAYAGHDIRQPLQALHLLLAGLMGSGLNPRQQDTARMMEASVDALSDLLDSLLDISKLDAGAVKPQWRTVDLDVLLARLMQEFVPQAADKGLRLRLRLPPGALGVRTDERLLSSALRNLLGNAIKYTQRGSVLVAVRRHGERLKVQVRDSGIGIPPEHVGRIFDEYYQVDNPQRDRSLGLGLGLAIVRRISDLLGLGVRCRSRPGQGTVMEISLPLLPAHEAAPLVAASAAAGLDLTGQHVVVVEDAEEVAQALISWLQARGARVTRHASAEAALAAPGIASADLYLSDYRLPGRLSGIDLLNTIRRQRGDELPALLLTGDTSSEFIAMAAASGWPILFKPVNPRELAAMLRLAQETAREPSLL